MDPDEDAPVLASRENNISIRRGLHSKASPNYRTNIASLNRETDLRTKKNSKKKNKKPSNIFKVNRLIALYRIIKQKLKYVFIYFMFYLSFTKKKVYFFHTSVYFHSHETL